MTTIWSIMRPRHVSPNDAGERGFILIACLASMASLTSTAKADPLTGTVTLTIARDAGLAGYGGGIAQGPLVYSSGSVDLGQLFQSQIQPGGTVLYQGLSLTGPLLLPHAGGLLDLNVQTSFVMKIAFNGASGSQPTIDVTGSLTGNAYGEPNGTSAGTLSVTAYGTPETATLEGWKPNSGVPMTLINRFLTPSNYSLYLATGPGRTPATASFALMANPSAITIAPEPATVLFYLAAIGALGFRRLSWNPKERHP